MKTLEISFKKILKKIRVIKNRIDNLENAFLSYISLNIDKIKYLLLVIGLYELSKMLG
jgi:hypothetical protein